MPHRVPPEEQPALERLLGIRAKLSVVKRDRSSYLKLEDIMAIRYEIEQEMKALSQVRGGCLLDESRELNRADDILDEVLQMLSLCFLSLGKKREGTAVYSQVVAIKHIFDRLQEFGVYEEEYLQPYKLRLDEIDKLINVDGCPDLSDIVMQVLRYQYRQCRRIYQNLIDTIHEVAPELIPIRDKLLRIRRNLASVCCRSHFSPNDIKPLQDKIRAIDNMRIDGKFVGEDGVTIPAGQGVLVSLLEQLYYWSHDLIIVCSADFSSSLQSVRERLLGIKAELERLELTHKWTLRQTDLFTYQHQLHDIVKMRYNVANEETNTRPELHGKFLDGSGEAPEGQTILEFLLHKCYRLIFVLLSESAPVSEALAPVYNQLVTVRHCLLAVKHTGAPCSPEELYPYQMKLASIEKVRKDGNFYDDRGQIPEGQAICVDILEDCYQILESLREETPGIDERSSYIEDGTKTK
ncbi:hypothetical protein INT47_011564 [Mucor saturninus]|uniref:Uncharacterized protein n=1 Tax=Mucor saturninus TaxID=64648 RepID=A0A8H7QW53_9FUNG|nr:hypothetical protein INT47_011564 [Mucor saturninus]